MYVPNYVPSQIEIPGSIAEANWKRQLRFLRVTSMWFLIILALVTLATLIIPGEAHLLPNAVVLFLFGCLALNMVRTFARDSQWERGPSLFIALFCIASAGLAFGGLARAGWPVWSIATSGVCFATYTFLCGRDFSFVGQFVLAGISAMTINAMIVLGLHLPPSKGLEALLLSWASVLYFTYDLASIMSRRRKGEELHAAIDFMRDYFNFIGFAVRCRRHWKEHRIFVIPRNP